MHSAIRQLATSVWVVAVLTFTVLAPSRQVASQPAPSGYSLRFYGHGVDDIDRVKISVDDPATSLPGPPVDVGATDFTIEFWLRALDAENNAPAVACGANVNWIYGNIVLDRDRFSLGRKYGLSIDGGGRIVFGVTNDAQQSLSICGTTSVLDGQWHHVAVQRRVSDGWLWLYVDGALQTQADGPDGDISYPDSATPSYRGPQYCQGPANVWAGYCRNEPFIVLGAEKHDAGQSEGNRLNYPAFSGWLDELRISTVLRYATAFSRPVTPFQTDAATAGLYRFDEGPLGPCLGVVVDSSQALGGPSNGQCFYGGAAPAGPEYVLDTPAWVLPPTATATAATATATLDPAATATATSEPATVTPAPVATETPQPTPTPTNTPQPTATNTNTPEPTATPTNTPQPTATNTPTPTNTPQPTATNTATPTSTSTATPTSTPQPTATNTATATPTSINTPQPSPTNTNTPQPTATNTAAPTSTPTATPTPALSDAIFADGFEAIGLNAWSSAVTDGDDIDSTTTAAIIGARGLDAWLDDNTAIYVTDDRPVAEPRYRVRFYFDPNSIGMAANDAHYIFYGYAGASTVVLRVEFGWSGSAYRVRASLVNDGTAWTTSAWVNISDAPHYIELDWRAATAAGANNGGLTLWVDGTQRANMTGVDNDTRRIDRVRLGAIAGIDSGTRGGYFFDAFESRRQTYIGPVGGATATPTPTPTPTLTPISTPTPSPTPTPTVLPTNTPAPLNYALQFDGADDFALTSRTINGNAFTAEAWVRPSVSAVNGVALAEANLDAGWSIEFENGRATLWVRTDQGWQFVQNNTVLAANTWYHVAVTYNAGVARIYINGLASAQMTIAGALQLGPNLRIGGVAGYPFFNGAVDDVRISNTVRYSANFTPPANLPAPDAGTAGQWTFSEGSGQTTANAVSGGSALTRGGTTSPANDDPAWVTANR
jgi:hypothetical protein